MTVEQAIRHVVEQISPLARENKFPAVEQVDFLGAEDGTISVAVHFTDGEVNGGLPVMSNFDVADLVRDEFEIAIAAAGIMAAALAETSQPPARLENVAGGATQ
jgi:hypothetical protein